MSGLYDIMKALFFHTSTKTTRPPTFIADFALEPVWQVHTFVLNTSKQMFICCSQ